MSAPAPDPSTVPSSCRFRETALASGLLRPDQLEAAEAEVRLLLDGGTVDPATWDQTVADTLVAQGLLTRFQAREMLAGRRRFRLGQYTVLDEIGRGGMGQVFRAEHAMMGREVALKVLPRAKSTPEYEAAFRREIRVLASLDHENLVRALDAGHDAKVYYLVTELVPGVDLRKQVLKYGPLDEAAAASVITQAAQGLAYAHEQGLVHRDVKPGNLLVTQDGRVKVLDLGLAGSTLDDESTSTGRVVGTIDYMAPEQIRTPDAVGPAADVYGLGCTLYFAISGQVPFPGGTRKEKAQRQLSETPAPLGQVAPRVDPELCRVVEAMMKKAPAERIGSAAEVIQRLRPWAPRTPVPMSRTPVGARPSDPVRPPPLPAAQSSSGRSARGGAAPGDDGWPFVPGSAAGDFAWPVPPKGSAGGAGEDFPAALLGLAAGRGAATKLVQAVGLATLAGIGVGLAMRVIRQSDLDGFADASPAMAGCLAFLFVLGAQAAVSRGGRRRR